MNILRAELNINVNKICNSKIIKKKIFLSRMKKQMLFKIPLTYYASGSNNV